MILMREMTAAVDRTGGDSTSLSTPSIRNRTLRDCSKGSTWMSEARISTARCMMRFTIRMTGASEARSFRCSTSASLTSSSLPKVSTISPISDFPGPSWVSSARSISVPRPTRRHTRLWQASAMASSTSWSNGSVTAITTSSSEADRPIRWFSFRKRIEIVSGRGDVSG